MQEIEITKSSIQEVSAPVPATLEDVLEPQWLGTALAHLSGGAKVASVEMAELVKAMAAKVRAVVTFEGEPKKVCRICVKGFLDNDLGGGGISTLREADFYHKIAPKISMLTPPCAAIVTDREASDCAIIMTDMIAEGVHFYDALEPLTVSQVAETLDQLARLHAHPSLLEGKDWIPFNLGLLAGEETYYLTWEKIQELMHDERRGDLPDATLDATLLKQSIQALAARNKTLPQTILHGDVHPGNVYRTADGKLGFTDWQCLQRGHWSLDVAYHICSVLPEEVAAKEERQLLKHYLESLRSHGGECEDFDTAWGEYSRAVVYGYYQWCITQRVKRPILNQAFRRLGAAVTRLDSHRLLSQ